MNRTSTAANKHNDYRPRPRFRTLLAAVLPAAIAVEYHGLHGQVWVEKLWTQTVFPGMGSGQVSKGGTYIPGYIQAGSTIEPRIWTIIYAYKFLKKKRRSQIKMSACISRAFCGTYVQPLAMPQITGPESMMQNGA